LEGAMESLVKWSTKSDDKQTSKLEKLKSVDLNEKSTPKSKKMGFGK